MPDTGAPHELPYPPSTGVTPDVPRDMEALAAQVAQRLDAMVPSGTLMATARSAAPGGFLICDGTAVSRSTYAALFTAISTTYGPGNGTTTFNLPDLRGRVPVGVDGAAARLSTSDALGQVNGFESITLSESNLPDTVPTNSNYASTGSRQATVSNGTGNVVPRADPATGTWDKGGGTGHYNMPPYQIVNWMIKT